MTIYFDFETTAPTDNCLDPEPKKMFVMSYVLIVAFHPLLKLRKIIVQRSYGHSLKQLTDIDYLTDDQMKFIDLRFVKQLRDTAQEVGRRKCKNALGQMFSIETALIKTTLLGWFNKKIKSQYLELDLAVKNEFERQNPIDWQKDKCVICKMLLKIDPLGYDVPNPEISYGDFFIRFKHKFLRNIYIDEEIKQLAQIFTLQSYCKLIKNLLKFA